MRGQGWGGWLVVLVVVGLLAGCSGGDGGVFDASAGSSTTSVPGESTTTVPGETTTTSLAGLGLVEVVSPDLGVMVVVGDGLVAGDQLLVVLAEGLGRVEAEGVAAALGGTVVGRVELINLWQLQIPPTDAAGLAAAAAAAAAVPGVVVAGPNAALLGDEEVWGVRQSPLNGPPYGGADGAGYRMIGVQKAWAYLRGSGLPKHPVHIGFIDSGIWTGNGEFDGVTLSTPVPGSGVLAAPEHSWQQQADGTWVDLGPLPYASHGTMTAGIAVADGDDGGMVGVADPVEDLTVSTTGLDPASHDLAGLQMVPADLSDEAQIAVANNGVSWTTGVMQAIVAQVNDGARVINMSLGCRNCNAATAAMYRLFFTQMAERHPEVLFVASAGNDNLTEEVVAGDRTFPGGLALPNMITVGNVQNDGTSRETSNRTSGDYEVTLAAPGHQAVQGVGPDGTVVNTGGGTSAAAPQVTATAAMLLAIKPDLTAEQIKNLLVETARSEIVRDDGTTQEIDGGLGGVGGRVLAADLALRRLVAEERQRANLEPFDLSPEQLEQLGVIDAVAVSDDPGEWKVRGIIYECDPGCTDVTISLLRRGMAIGGDTTQHLDAAGEVTWQVTVEDYPASILVTRTDNGAASLITLQPPTLDGHYEGTVTLGDSVGSGCPVQTGTVPFEFNLVTNPDGTGTANDSWAWVTWGDGQIQIAVSERWVWSDDTVFDGAYEQGADAVTMSGTWTGTVNITVSGGGSDTTSALSCPISGTWEATRTG